MFDDSDQPILAEQKFLIEAISIDPLENEYSDALKYRVVGYVDSQAEAYMLIARGGFEEGTGWPIDKGSKLPKLRAIPINRIDRPDVALHDPLKNDLVIASHRRLSEGAQIIADAIAKRE